MIREYDDPAGVLSFARERRSWADRAEADLLGAAVDWAAMHSADSILDAPTAGELRYRLPRPWRRVLEGDLPAGRRAASPPPPSR